MNIEAIFNEVSKQMRSDLERARQSLHQPGLKGESFEETFRKFLDEYLPKALNISTGILVDSSGNETCQLDVIISDSTKTPVFYRSGNIRVIPVECAYAVIEVKANLDTNELDKIFKNMESVRSLKKVAYYKPAGITYVDNLYGKEWEIWPINYYVFGYDSIDIKLLAEYINKKHKEKNLLEDSRIDIVCVLDKGVILNQLSNGTVDALPQPKSKLLACPTTKSLLLFYALISTYLNQTRLPNFRFKDYIANMKFGFEN